MSERELNRVQLRPVVKRDFQSSAEFIGLFGQQITAKGMFLPGPSRFQNGQELEIQFTLNGAKDILAGTVEVVFVRDGANGEQPGTGVRFLALNARSQKNLDMIVAWRKNA